nr:PTS transporter subunit EIIC [Cetobacterium sp. NK01]
MPIITALFAFLIGLGFPFVWEPIQNTIGLLSKLANGENQALSTFIFGFTERALIPTGLHHIFILLIGSTLVNIPHSLEILLMEIKLFGLKCLRKE